MELSPLVNLKLDLDCAIMRQVKLICALLFAIVYMSGRSTARPECVQPETGNPDDVSIGTSHLIHYKTSLNLR